MWENFPLFPAQASTMAQKVDALYIFLCAVTAFFTVLIFLMILVFAIKYRRSRNPHATPIEGNNALELTWSVIPLGIALFIFVWSTAVYFSYASVPKNAIQVYAVGKQWMWKFQHADGQREINQLHVPVGSDVAVTMISQDVIHSFFVPAFRVKMDVLPGRYRTAWFKATKTGSYHLFCAEYCGTMHSGMIGEVTVMEPADYQRWLTQNGEGSMASSGEKLFRHFGCISCHRADSGQRGPDLAGLYGKKVFLSDGRSLIADENYIRESIVEPKAKIVAGFQPIMPTFQGQVTEDEMLQLVAYIKGLKQMPTNVNPDADIPSPEMRRRNPNLQPQPGEPIKVPNK